MKVVKKMLNSVILSASLLTSTKFAADTFLIVFLPLFPRSQICYPIPKKSNLLPSQEVKFVWYVI